MRRLVAAAALALALLVALPAAAGNYRWHTATASSPSASSCWTYRLYNVPAEDLAPSRADIRFTNGVKVRATLRAYSGRYDHATYRYCGRRHLFVRTARIKAHVRVGGPYRCIAAPRPHRCT